MIAAVILLAGCGGGSGTKSTGTPSVGGSPTGTSSVGGSRQVVSAKEGAFRTVVPVGLYLQTGSEFSYYATTGPQEHGAPTAVLVLHEPVPPGGINAFVRSTLRALKRQSRSARRLSGPFALRVGGEPALAVDYLQPEEGGKESRWRQVFVMHGESFYVIREYSSPAQHAVGLAALEEVLSHWQWQ